MSFVKNDNQQLTLLDSTFNLTEREKRMLEKSWAKTFADKIFPSINEEIFSALYSSNASRPNTPVNVIVGALILKEALGERGTPGNAEYIIYVAEKLIEVYKSDHLWAVDFKCISVPEMFEKLIEYTSELSKSIIEDIENFIDDYHKRINELAYGLEHISGEKVVSFNLELRSPDMNKIDAEIKRLEEILLNN